MAIGEGRSVTDGRQHCIKHHLWNCWELLEASISNLLLVNLGSRSWQVVGQQMVNFLF